MRISDWSSDVCSSDLEHEPPSAADLLPVATPAWLIDIAEDTAWLLRRGADTCTEENADLENLRCRHIALFREAGLLCGGGRSEEQKSELQSLMRISFAVFCLKNKTTHNYQAHY